MSYLRFRRQFPLHKQKQRLIQSTGRRHVGWREARWVVFSMKAPLLPFLPLAPPRPAGAVLRVGLRIISQAIPHTVVKEHIIKHLLVIVVYL